MLCARLGTDRVTAERPRRRRSSVCVRTFPSRWGRPPDRPLLVGSVKSNIGHAEAAGGLAGLVKAVLCLEHRQVPASLHVETPHPGVAWDELPLEIPAELTDLPDLLTTV